MTNGISIYDFKAFKYMSLYGIEEKDAYFILLYNLAGSNPIREFVFKFCKVAVEVFLTM